MTIVAFVPDPTAAHTVVAWARTLAEEAEALEFLCWEPEPGEATQEAVRAALGDARARVSTVHEPEPFPTVVSKCVESSARLLVTCRFELAGGPRPRTSSALIDAAPCRTFVALYGEHGPKDVQRVLAYLDGTAHDRAVVELARRLADAYGVAVTPATIEDDIGEGAEEVGRRSLRSALHDAGVADEDRYEPRVVVDNHPVRGMLRCAEGHELVLVGATSARLVEHLEKALKGTTAVVVKRRPPLRRRMLPDWIPRINPSDYAELVQDLRSGSRWRIDFIVMLAMASAIATLGLIQNSPAVVIGSMLLAPLMTPMIGFGLALVQANPRLVRLSMESVGLGIVLTLLVSFVIAWVTPAGETLSPETLSRCQPNLLDLGIAFFAAIAAAFALARPGIAAAVAGVAIATALVPPLCSVGISLAYAEFLNALGAFVLFTTNVLTIVVAASLTFTLMGVSADRALPPYRRRARRVIAVLVGLVLVLSIPLSMTLAGQLDEGRAQPLGYPVTRALLRAVTERIDGEEGMELMFLGRSAKQDLVLIHVAADEDVDRSLGDELVSIVRREMDREDLPVKVIAVRRVWKD